MIHLNMSTDGEFYFNINGKNGKVLATSETYKKKQSAAKGITALVEMIVRSVEFEKDKMVLPVNDHTKIKTK